VSGGLGQEHLLDDAGHAAIVLLYDLVMATMRDVIALGPQSGPQVIRVHFGYRNAVAVAEVSVS
jgi:hypothetical protein